jgi:hypothetical protein
MIFAQNPDPAQKARVWSQIGVLQFPLYTYRIVSASFGNTVTMEPCPLRT